MPRRQKYLNNKDMLIQIHKSKTSFCYYIDKSYTDFDIILPSVDDINEENILFARLAKAKRIKDGIVAKMKESGKTVKASNVHVDPNNDVQLEELVFRVMTYDHIPEDPTRKKNPKTEADRRTKVPFPPYKHYAFVNDELKEVGRSHWKGGLKNGRFDLLTGKVTNELAMMYLKLVERYSMRSNWRGYTYVDEMRGQALLQLSQIGLQFDESKSQNPFAYYTAAITNSFTRVLNVEKRNQNIRDDMLQEAGAMPSFTRQIKHEEEQKLLREQKLNTQISEEAIAETKPKEESTG